MVRTAEVYCVPETNLGGQKIVNQHVPQLMLHEERYRVTIISKWDDYDEIYGKAVGVDLM